MTPKVALISGASSGIGLGTARVFEDHGWVVYSLSRTAPPGGTIHIPFDLAKTGDLAAALKDLPRIDCLVHNAGITEGPIMELGPIALYRLLEVCDGRLKAASGSLIFVSSFAAGREKYGLYGEAKAHGERLTTMYGRENAAHGVRANIVRPHYITRTRNWPRGEDAPATIATIPLRRFGEPEDVASLIYELATNPFITGATVPIDGGVTLLETEK